MKDLFANLYSRVVNFFKSTENIGEQTKEVARNRLKLVLMQDRTNLTPAVLERMRGELINLLSKYVELDKELLELNFEQEGEQMALMLSIPVVRAKTEEEIQKAIQEDEAIKNVALADDDDEEETEEGEEGVKQEEETSEGVNEEKDSDTDDEEKSSEGVNEEEEATENPEEVNDESSEEVNEEEKTSEEPVKEEKEEPKKSKKGENEEKPSTEKE